MRTHIVLPDELVKRIDGLVGKRKRSRFVVEAIAEKLRGEALLSVLAQTAGILKEGGPPAWATTEKAATWVRKSRQRDDARMQQGWQRG